MQTDETADYQIDQIGKIPTTDQRDLGKLKQEFGQATGSINQNTLGQQAGDALDGLRRDISGR